MLIAIIRSNVPLPSPTPGSVWGERFSIACFCLLALGFSSTAQSADWSRFRGPNGDGHVQSVTLPSTWSEQQNVTWKVSVPGNGHSSPVIADQQIWLTTAITTELTEAQKQERLADAQNPKQLDIVGSLSLRALCFEQKTGKLLHDIEVFSPEEPEPIHYTNTYASPTPVLQDGRLYVHFGAYGSSCIDAATGEIVWRNSELIVDHQNGPGSSPILWNDLMIVHFDGIDRQFIAALNIKDGSLAWKTDRSGEMDPKPDMKKAYCTPVVVQVAGHAELVSPAANWVYGYDPASGSELWKAYYGELGFSTVPCPVVGNDMAYVCTSFGKTKLLAVRYGGQGDVTKTHIAWENDSQISKKPSLLLDGQELYVCNDTGIVTCLDALSGAEIWRERVGGNFSASPLYAGGLIYLFDQEGKTTVLRAGRKFELVAKNELAEGCNASPAVADNALFVRTASQLYRIEQ